MDTGCVEIRQVWRTRYCRFLCRCRRQQRDFWQVRVEFGSQPHLHGNGGRLYSWPPHAVKRICVRRVSPRAFSIKLVKSYAQRPPVSPESYLQPTIERSWFCPTLWCINDPHGLWVHSSWLANIYLSSLDEPAVLSSSAVQVRSLSLALAAWRFTHHKALGA